LATAIRPPPSPKKKQEKKKKEGIETDVNHAAPFRASTSLFSSSQMFRPSGLTKEPGLANIGTLPCAFSTSAMRTPISIEPSTSASQPDQPAPPMLEQFGTLVTGLPLRDDGKNQER